VYLICVYPDTGEIIPEQITSNKKMHD